MVREANIHETKTHLSRLLKRVQAGDEVIINKAGKPIARIVPYQPKPKKRIFGQKLVLDKYPENFNDPMPDWWLKLWYK